jgi:hypothetical protein
VTLPQPGDDSRPCSRPLPHHTSECDGHISSVPVPAFTKADEVIMLAVESGTSVQPWQMSLIAHFLPEQEAKP